MSDWVNSVTQGLPAWVVPAIIVHIALLLALIVPTWRAFARARAGGWISLVLILPGLGLLVVAIMMAAVVLRRAHWSPAWFILVLIPVVNIVFMWLFAFAAWSEKPQRSAAVAPADDPWEPAPHAPPLDDERKTRPPAAKTQPPAAKTQPPAAKPAVEPSERDVETGKPAAPPPPPPPPPAPPPPPPPPAVVPPPVVPPPVEAKKEGEPDLTLVARAPDPVPADGADRPGRTIPGTPYDDEEEKEPAKEADTKPPSRKQTTPKGRAWQLTGANERAKGLDFAVFEEDLRQAENGLHIGRSTRSNIILEDESVSRNHARLLITDGKLLVEDLDSMNGTWVDGAKAESGTPLELNAGTEVEFGKLKLVVTER